MDELIKEMLQKGLVSFAGGGKAKAVFQLLELMATTRPIDKNDIKMEIN